MKQLQKVTQYELPLNITPQKGGGFLASCPNWTDCYAQGDSVEEATLEITAVAQSLIELYKEEGLSIPLNLTKNLSPTKPLLTLPIIVAG